jgi:hypothetical protein
MQHAWQQRLYIMQGLLPGCSGAHSYLPRPSFSGTVATLP